MTRCASWLKFHDYLEAKETRLVDARFCGRSALCEACARRRAALVGQTYVPRVEAVLGANGGLKPALLTVTIKSVQDLRAGLELVRDAWKGGLLRARRYRSNPLRNSPSEFCKITGGVTALEVKRSKSRPDLWHPHLHAIVLLSDYIDQRKLSDEWKQLTGGSYVVDIRRIKTGGVMGGVREALKYPVKFGGLSAADCCRAFLAFRGIRQGRAIRALSSFGLLRGIVPDLDDFSGQALAGPYLEWFADWDHSARRYGVRSGRCVSEALAAAVAEAKASGIWAEAPAIDPEDLDEDGRPYILWT